MAVETERTKRRRGGSLRRKAEVFGQCASGGYEQAKFSLNPFAWIDRRGVHPSTVFVGAVALAEVIGGGIPNLTFELATLWAMGGKAAWFAGWTAGLAYVSGHGITLVDEKHKGKAPPQDDANEDVYEAPEPQVKAAPREEREESEYGVFKGLGPFMEASEEEVEDGYTELVRYVESAAAQSGMTVEDWLDQHGDGGPRRHLWAEDLTINEYLARYSPGQERRSGEPFESLGGTRGGRTVSPDVQGRGRPTLGASREGSFQSTSAGRGGMHRGLGSHQAFETFRAPPDDRRTFPGTSDEDDEIQAQATIPAPRSPRPEPEPVKSLADSSLGFLKFR